MKRLREVGSEEARRLLTDPAEEVDVPPGAEERVWRGIVRHREGKRRTRLPRWMALGAVFLTGSALAAAVTRGPAAVRWASALLADAPAGSRPAARRTAGDRGRVSPPRPPTPPPSQASTPRVEPPSPAATKNPRRGTRAVHAGIDARTSNELAPPILALEAPVPHPLPASPTTSTAPLRRHMIITRQGEAPLAFKITESEVQGGSYRGGVALTFDGRMVTGKFVGEVVWIRVGNDRAEGSIGDYQVRLRLAETRAGARLWGTVGGVVVRLELDGERLGWAPGCDRWLAADAASHGYQGRCTDESAVRLRLPPTFDALPPLRKLLVLAFLLPDYRDDLRASIAISGMSGRAD